ncbi:hypothetical protein ABT237_15965 [Streptomyces sp. NPDC001581]|uniref:hypothetical protein n=1 Tax=Streptomyces sp. NPDC001581 TaxID=3154386 RepID=UPI003333B349
MNDLGDARLRTWTLRFMTLLAADTQDQLAWLGEREVETKDVVEEAELLCRVSEGLAERGTFEPEDLRDLRAIGRRLDELHATCRVGLWDNALVTDAAWDDIRSLAREFLLTSLGDWRQPLPITRAPTEPSRPPVHGVPRHPYPGAAPAPGPAVHSPG